MAKKENHIPNYEAPVAGVTWFSPEQCKNCIFRFKDHFTIAGKTFKCTESEGYKKSSCEMFKYPGMKPREVMDNSGQCEYYEQEKRRN